MSFLNFKVGKKQAGAANTKGGTPSYRHQATVPRYQLPTRCPPQGLDSFIPTEALEHHHEQVQANLNTIRVNKAFIS